MMTMRRLMPFTIVMLLLMQTVALNLVTPAQAASGRGGTNDDFTVKFISVGNTSSPAEQWVQSDGTVMDYIFVGQSIEITVSIQRYGSSAIQEEAPVSLDIVHPIGFVMESYSFNTPLMTGGQTYNHNLVWAPSAAHSILNTTTNDLSGGLILLSSYGTVSRYIRSVVDTSCWLVRTNIGIWIVKATTVVIRSCVLQCSSGWHI